MSEIFNDKYELIGPLGEGGMASVWKAKVRGSAGFERNCVIKRILAGPSADGEAISMFVREAKLCARLHHRNIVQVFDFGEAGGEYFMAMEFVEGNNLLEIIRALAGDVPPLGAAAFIARELCRALAYAHSLRDENGAELGLVHRDVSLSNVLVAFDGSVKLVDFGIAKAMSLGTIVSRAGAVKGKLAYMAPEQVTGELVDSRADLFAAGVVLHELICLQRLFRGDADEDTLRNILEMPIPKPSSRRSDVPPALDAIVLKALSRSVDHRFQRASDMADALDPIVRELGWDSGKLASWLEKLGTVPPAPATPDPDPTIEMMVEEPTHSRPAVSRALPRPPRPPAYSPLALAILALALVVTAIVLSR